MQMTDIWSRRTLPLTAALLGAALAGGCSVTEQGASSLLVAPGSYEFYSCPQLVDRARSLRGRQRELENLMAKASTDAAGRMMSAVTYRPDYLTVLGDLHEVERTARQKQCDLTPPPPKAAAPAAGRKAPRPR